MKNPLDFIRCPICEVVIQIGDKVVLHNTENKLYHAKCVAGYVLSHAKKDKPLKH